MPAHRNQDEEHKDTPFIFIPYERKDVEDNGTRPFPPAAKVVIYKCPNIRVNDVPYNGVPLTPGTAYQLKALVSNTGDIPASVTVRFYLGKPTTGLPFQGLLPGAIAFPVQPGEKEIESPAQTFTPSFSTPSHICIFAEATAPMDPADGSGDAFNKRHYAQQNVELAQGQPGSRLVFPFEAISTIRAGRHVIGIRQVEADRQGLTHMYTKYRAPLRFPPGALGLIDLQRRTDPQAQVRVDLHPGQGWPLQALVSIPEDAMPGASAELVIEQTPIDEERIGPTGAIGITIYVKG